MSEALTWDWCWLSLSVTHTGVVFPLAPGTSSSRAAVSAKMSLGKTVITSATSPKDLPSGGSGSDRGVGGSAGSSSMMGWWNGRCS